VKKDNIRIKCSDDFELAATIYQPEKIAGAIMIAPATGIKQGFYNSFATFLAEHDYAVVCFDNRGVGESIKGPINEVNASLVTWGELDMPAVLDFLINEFPKQKYHLIGHSAGGQLVGLMNNAKRLTSMFNFACSSGCIRNMPLPFKFSAHFFLGFFISVSNFLFGRTQSQWVGMGEPLPRKVGQQWQKWCYGKGYVETEFGDEVNTHMYDDLNLHSLWAYAIDDPIANLENVKDMIRIFPKIQSTIVKLESKAYGKKQIGHMGFFRLKNRELWSTALQWFEEHN
jgi:predicted alpha/beta hydrolase